MFSKIYTITLFLTLSMNAFSSVKNAEQVFLRSKASKSSLANVARELINDQFYFSSIPILKEYLSFGMKGRAAGKVDQLLEHLLSNVGVKQFETMPYRTLKKSSSPSINFIVAKKYFRSGKYKKSLDFLSKISSKHPLYPFALNIKGSAFSIMKDYGRALSAFEECLSQSTSSSNNIKKEQLEINHDYCLIGKARVMFARRVFNKANLTYLDLPKSSSVWPEILFEEAWNSYYQKNYNRTLGKLVTYKAPVLNHIFIPEIDVLRALSYYRLCLYEDAKYEVDKFYKTYEREGRRIKSYLRRNGKNFSNYFKSARVFIDNRKKAVDLVDVLVKAISYEPTFIEMYDRYKDGLKEASRVKGLTNSVFKRYLVNSIKESLVLQQKIMGSYVRKNLIIKYLQLQKAFQQMSYIKLEVLSQKKLRVYGLSEDNNRGRGDIKFLRRNEKQYFWTFNGEFWADELGDYVFSLKSEC